MVELANSIVLLFEALNAFEQWICDLQMRIFHAVIFLYFGVVQRGFHLPDSLDYALRLLGQFMFLSLTSN